MVGRTADGTGAVGKRTLTEQLRPDDRPAENAAEQEPPPASAPDHAGTLPFLQLGRAQFDTAPSTSGGSSAAPVQLDGGTPTLGDAAVRDVARTGVGGGGAPLPHLDAIQRSFGSHDVSGVRAHVHDNAATAARSIGATAYATGNDVAFASPPDLRTAAHEAAHVVQQRGGVSLPGGVGRAGDSYEQHADAVADLVVRGESAADLLGPHGGGSSTLAVQRAEPAPSDKGASPTADSPTPGINKPGFIDHGDGSNIRSGPAESGGQKLRDAPLPPATRVFVTGTHPRASGWWYVTANLPDHSMVRGYVQHFRVTTDLPEPLAKLYHVKSGDTAEKLAVQEFSGAVRDGHDLRYYENVLLHVNKERGRVGITGSYQDPGLLGGGSNNIQLVAGELIWLVSPQYARALESVVPSGSLTGGAVAKVKRFVGHIEDILKSVTESPSHFGEVAGEYAEAIRQHLPEIIGIVAGFIMAEALSAFLAVTPTGVGQIAAFIIQLGLATFGAIGLLQAGIEAVQHAERWLTLAWQAGGKEAQIALASKEFIKMLVSIAMAALAYLGVKGNLGKMVKIAGSLPPGAAPALAFAGGGTQVIAGTGAGVAIGGPGRAGPIAGGMMMVDESEGTGGSSKEPPKKGLQLPSGLDAKLRKVIEEIIERAQGGKLKKATGYHPHFDDSTVLKILSEPDAIYQSQGKSGRLIFRKGTDIAVVEATGSGKGNVVTGYGPSGIKSDSGAAALGGAAGDAGAPVTHEIIINGTIPVQPGRPPVPKAIQIAP